MKTRVLTGIVAFLVFVPFVIFADTPALPIGLSVCAVIAAWEMLHCVGLHKNLWLLIPMGAIALAMPIAFGLGDATWALSVAIIASFVFILYTYAVCVFSRGKVDIASASTALMGCMYTTAGFTAIIFIHNFCDGGEWLYLLVFIGAWITDIFAYFTGRLLGKHKLNPEISPKKTVEGSIGGILFCTLAFIGFTYVYNTWLVGETGDVLPYWLAAAAGVVASVASQIGDLSMSALKRHYGIKDFGKIFPGHGGILDRFDSVLAVAIMLAIALWVVPYL